MSGFADKNTKLALVGGIYFSVALIVGIGFTIRGAEVQARNEATMIPAATLPAPVTTVSDDKKVEAGKGSESERGNATGLRFDAGGLVEPALDVVTSRALRVVL